jgi:hypothetical protein
MSMKLNFCGYWLWDPPCRRNKNQQAHDDLVGKKNARQEQRIDD